MLRKKISNHLLILFTFFSFFIFCYSFFAHKTELSEPTSALGGGQIQHPDGTKGSSRCNQGELSWFVDVNNLNLIIQDTPIFYDSAYGPNIEFTLTYNLLAKNGKNNAIGNRWTHNYSEYVTFDETKEAITHHGAYGRIETYVVSGDKYYPDSANLIAGERINMPVLSRVSDYIYAHFMDGSYKVYKAFSDNTYRLTKLVDRSGNAVQVVFDNQRLIRVTNSEGKSLNFYYSDSKLVRIDINNELSAEFGYNSNGYLTKVVDFEDKNFAFSYDENGFIHQITDDRGTTFIDYEPEASMPASESVGKSMSDNSKKNHRIIITDNKGQQSEYFYESSSGMSWYIAPEFYVPPKERKDKDYLFKVPKTTYHYKRFNKGYSRLSKITYPDGFIEYYTYDENRNLSQIKYSNGDFYTYENNIYGNVIKSFDRYGNVTDYTYDHNQNLVKLSSVLGVETFSYDSKNRLISEKDTNGNITWYKYNKKGQYKFIKNSDHKILDFIYDKSGRLIKILDKNNVFAEFDYNIFGKASPVNDDDYQYASATDVLELNWYGKNLQIYPKDSDDLGLYF
ncbi:RHS repeat protein [Photobacterium sp. J15]|uniref:RHS repeat protein n=1 Tax=Photobacterium sp. J15 TaxID=265901 RepID=UPI0007E4CA99|nr:RHS repeat protein [Photobacterium sp. J15]